MCVPCGVIKQLAINFALLFDKFINTCLLGNPNDTLSIRFARAADKGERWAQLVCRFLSLFVKNHCQNAETHGSLGKELWHW